MADTLPPPVAYLYTDANVPEDAHPWLHSTMLVLAADRRPTCRNETPLYTAAQVAQAVAEAVEKERERCAKKPLSPQQLDALIERWAGGAELADGEYSAMVMFAAAVEREHGISSQPPRAGQGEP